MNHCSKTGVEVVALTALLTALVFMASHSAADYRYQLDASYGDRSGSFSNVRSRSLAASYFFAAVDDSQGPLALASFIDRASSVTVFATDSEVSFDTPTGVFSTVMLSPGTFVPVLDNAYDIITPISGAFTSPISFAAPKLKRDSVGAAIEYVSDSGWIVGGKVATDDASEGAFLTTENEEGVALELRVGRYVSDLFSVTLSYRHADQDSESTFRFPICAPPAPCTSTQATYLTANIKDRSWSLASRYVLPLGTVFHEFTAAADFGVQSLDTQVTQLPFPSPFAIGPVNLELDRWQLAGGYAYYPRNDVSIGLNVTHLDLEGEERQTFALGSTWFVNPAIALRASLVRSNVDAGSFDVGFESDNGFELALTGRF